MAVPKRKTSKSRRDKRRSNVWKLSGLNFSKCSKCGEFKIHHRMCKSCGFYKNTKIVEVAKT